MGDTEPGSLAFILLISNLSSSASSPTCRPALPLSCLLLVCPIWSGGLLLGAHTGLTCRNRHLYPVTEQPEPSSPPSCFKLHPEGAWWAPGQGRSRLPIRGQEPWAWAQNLPTYFREVHPSQPFAPTGVSELCASASALFAAPTRPSGPSLPK